jgi:uncharacterized membrane protein YeaQ/YmgE (transglycosylase-associated protein family)
MLPRSFRRFPITAAGPPAISTASPWEDEEMSATNLLIFLIIGALAGWVAGLLMKGRGFGVLGNIVVGVIGAFLGGWLLPMIGVSFGGTVGLFVTALIGAVVLLFLVSLIKRA